MSSASEQELVVYVWAYARAGMHHPGLFRAAAARLQPALAQLPPTSLAHLAAAYSGAQAAEPFAQQLLEVAGARLLEFRPQELALLAHAAAASPAACPQQRRELLEAVALAAETILPRFNTRSLAMLAEAYALAQQPAPELFDAMAALLSEPGSQLQLAKSLELAKLCWAYARLEQQDEELFEAIADAVVAGAADLQAGSVARLAWGFAAAGQHQEELFSALAGRAGQLVQEMAPGDVAAVAWAFATAGHVDLPLTEALLQRARLRAGEFSAAQLADVLWALAGAGRHDSQLLQGISAAVKAQPRAFGAADAAKVLQSLAAVRHYDAEVMKALLGSLLLQQGSSGSSSSSSSHGITVSHGNVECAAAAAAPDSSTAAGAAAAPAAAAAASASAPAPAGLHQQHTRRSFSDAAPAGAAGEAGAAAAVAPPLEDLAAALAACATFQHACPALAQAAARQALADVESCEPAALASLLWGLAATSQLQPSVQLRLRQGLSYWDADCFTDEQLARLHEAGLWLAEGQQGAAGAAALPARLAGPARSAYRKACGAAARGRLYRDVAAAAQELGLQAQPLPLPGAPGSSTAEATATAAAAAAKGQQRGGTEVARGVLQLHGCSRSVAVLLAPRQACAVNEPGLVLGDAAARLRMLQGLGFEVVVVRQQERQHAGKSRAEQLSLLLRGAGVGCVE
jgi:Meckel syndrome type 1 protein